ncbi:PLC-like phosphodiesterase [Atractiella rhizophila]|nr:PLC-like phosphodiesterase [Atractiella rhizophila]
MKAFFRSSSSPSSLPSAEPSHPSQSQPTPSIAQLVEEESASEDEGLPPPGAEGAKHVRSRSSLSSSSTLEIPGQDRHGRLYHAPSSDSLVGRSEGAGSNGAGGGMLGGFAIPKIGRIGSSTSLRSNASATTTGSSSSFGFGKFSPSFTGAKLPGGAGGGAKAKSSASASASALSLLSLSALSPLSPTASDGLPSPTQSKSTLLSSLKGLAPEKYLASLSAHPVSVRIVNRTGCEIRWGKWPVRDRRHGKSRVDIGGVKGEWWEDICKGLNCMTVDEYGKEELEVAKMKGVGLTGDGMLGGKKAHFGWLYLDLVLPSGRLLHFQIYLRLRRPSPITPSPVHTASIGRFDLDSTMENPQSSGYFDHALLLAKDSSDEELKVVFVLEEGLGSERNRVNDETMRQSLLVPAKGVRISSWCSHKKGTISVSAAKEARYHEYDLWTSARNPNLGVIVHSKHVLEGFLDSKHIWIHVQHDGDHVMADYVKVNPLTGQASTKGQLASTLETPAKILREIDMSINYGFSDAGVKKSNQVYVYVTHFRGNWLAQLIQDDPNWLKVPFCKLALPGSHDCGMFTKLDGGLYNFIKHGSNSLVKTAAKEAANEQENRTGDLLPLVQFLMGSLKLFNIEPHRAIHNMANTQKDSIKTQLELGVRFFDMRPGWCFYDCYDNQKTVLHHQHSIVPGVHYVQFLVDIFNFLGAYEQEIVLVELKDDNIIKKGNLIPISMVPTVDELERAMEEARLSVAASARAIKLASKEDLARPIGELIKENKRLFFFDRVHEEEPWQRADSYDGKAYNTFKPEPILERLKETHARFSKLTEEDATSPTKPPRGTIYQLQATPTADIGADIAASLTYSDASSLLVYMKAVMDRETYSWIGNHDFDDPGNPVFLNDFVDGALVEHCIEVSKQRATKHLNILEQTEEEVAEEREHMPHIESINIEG